MQKPSDIVYDNLRMTKDRITEVRMRRCMDLRVERKLDPETYQKLINAENQLDEAILQVRIAWEDFERKHP